MAQKDLHHRITGDSTSLEAASRRGSTALTAMERESRRLERQQQRTHAAMTQTGRGMLLAGAAIAAGVALSVRAAVEWESAWAGVLKTVDGTDAQMAALEEEIRSLTGVLPASHREIAAVAEAAGQLGVQRENVAAFTKTMIDMGEATNLTSDEAATALARLMNIMQTAPGDVERLASTIVDLGNKGATTESEITEMALRIAGAARTIGLTEQQVVGFAAALSNVGIRAEAGGTAISRVFLEIDSAVSAGGDNLETFAEIAGMTAAEFRQAYEQDAGAAIAKFIVGLSRVQETGGDVNAILTDLGLTEIRVSDALRRLAGSGDNLTSSLRIGASAWDENTALAAEAERRYGTTAAQIGIARNQMNDFAIDIGSTLLPVLGSAASTLGAVGEVIGDLPGPMKTALAILAVLTAGILLAGGAALLAVPRIAAYRAAIDQLSTSTSRLAVATVGASRTLGRVGSFLAGPWGIALGIGVTALAAFGVAQAKTRAEIAELTDTLDDQTGAITLDTKAKVLNELESSGMAEQASALGISMDTLVDAALGEAAALEQVSAATAGVRAEQEAMSGEHVFVRTKDLNNELQSQADKLQAAQERWQRQSELTDGATTSMEALEPAARATAEGLGLTADEATTLTDEVEDLDKALKALLGIMFGVEEAQDAAAQALRRVTDAATENGTRLKGNSDAALANRDNVRGLIEADFDLINAMHEAGSGADELTEASERLKQKFIDQMVQAGFSEEAVEEYAEAYDLIPSEVSTLVSTPGMTAAERNIRNLKASIDRIPRRVDIDIHQSIFAPVGSQRVGHQHGGEVFGPGGIDRVPAMLTAGEFVIRRSEAQRHKALLADINSGRFAHAQHLGTGGQVKAAAEMLRQLRSGGQFFEDFTFRGHSATVGRFHDQLADQFYGAGGEFNRGQLEAFLRKASRPAPTPAPRLADAAWAARNTAGRMPAGAMSAGGGGGQQVHRFVFDFRTHGNRQAQQFAEDFRYALRADPAFRVDVRDA